MHKFTEKLRESLAATLGFSFYSTISKAHLIYGWDVALALLSAVSLFLFFELVNPVLNELSHCFFPVFGYSPQFLKSTGCYPHTQSFFAHLFVYPLATHK